jgi:signal transduction histidine kinase
MVQDTSLSLDAKTNERAQPAASADLTPAVPDLAPRSSGVRTNLLLVLAMAVVTITVTGLSLLLIRHELRLEVSENLSQDLTHSVGAFEDMQAERMSALQRENSLLANLPTLKALMTSRDDLTIQDGAVEFWNLSGNDLFALADANGRVIANFSRGNSSDTALRDRLSSLVASTGKSYLIDGRSLYACSVRPLYFGSEESGTLLGYVISGTSIERTLRQISSPTGVEAAFLSSGKVVASTFDSVTLNEVVRQPPLLAGRLGAPASIQSGSNRYLAAAQDLTSRSTAPLQLVVFKSFAIAERSINHIDRMILSVGALALLAGAALMVVLSRVLTRPLEQLSLSVRAFGIGNGEYRIPRYGTREVRQLSTAFSAMRHEIEDANRARLEAERLATIGRMASSISHDFRHYLASIYANAEFLLTSRISEKERAEIFEEIRMAVLGSTEMIESLLVFSRTGKQASRAPNSVSRLLEQTIALVRAHPDAEGVSIVYHCSNPTQMTALVDGKQIERGMFNLLLNACQAARLDNETPTVTVQLDNQEEVIVLKIADNGAGVPESIRNNLFEPFVSVGKQKGTGLGLTLAARIATEHGGSVNLLTSIPGRTIFQMKFARHLADTSSDLPSDTQHHDRVISHETT